MKPRLSIRFSSQWEKGGYREARTRPERGACVRKEELLMKRMCW